MAQPLGIVEIMGLAASISLLSGWRLYLCVLATGIAMQLNVLPLPEHLASLQILANPWVMGTAAVAAFCEFFADKIMLVDTVWDAVHTFIRPLGGALLALAVIDPGDPATQAIAFILGSGATLLAHSGKAGARAVINASPEPFSNIAVSTAEDVTTGGLLYLMFAYPMAAGIIAIILLGLAIWLLLTARRIIRQFFGQDKPPPAPEA